MGKEPPFLLRGYVVSRGEPKCALAGADPIRLAFKYAERVFKIYKNPQASSLVAKLETDEYPEKFPGWTPTPHRVHLFHWAVCS